MSNARAEFKAWTSACRKLLRVSPGIRACHTVTIAGRCLEFRLSDAEGWASVDMQRNYRSEMTWKLRDPYREREWWERFFNEACTGYGKTFKRLSLANARKERLGA